jgi:hypothetical protein
MQVFGLSFCDDGKVKGQFEVIEEYEEKAKVLFYSWLTGDPTITEIVPKSWIEGRCKIYNSHDEWLAAAEYLGSKVIQNMRLQK